MSVSIDGTGSLIGIDQGLNIVGLTTLTGGIILDDSISHIGDADTKIRFPAADTFTVETAGSERLRITAAGKIGIGTAVPTHPLHINATGTSYVKFSDEASGAGATDGAIFGLDNPHLYAWNYQAGDFVVATNATERLRIDSSGRLLKSGQAALTSTSLSHPVQVACSSDADGIAIIGRAADDIGELSFYEADKTTNLGEIQYRRDHVNFRHRVGYISFATGGTTERFRIASGGEVSIGGFAPTAGAGILQISGGLRVAGSASASDTNTPYIYRTSGSDHLNFATSGVERLRIQSNGRVGINRVTSSFMLDIVGNSSTGANCIRIVDGAETGHGSHPAKIVAGGTYYHEMQMHSRRFTVHTWDGSNIAERFRVHQDGTIKCGTSSTLKAEINNSVSGHQFISQCSDNNNGFEVYQQHGSNTTRNTFAVYANTGNSNAKNLQFAVRGDGVVSSPQQPAFQVHGFASHRYMNSWQDVDLGSWNYVEQNGSHFNNSNGRFTAPVAGKYFFIYTAMFQNPNTNDFAILIKKNNVMQTLSNNHSGGGSSNGHTWNDTTVQAIMTMAANDYVTFTAVGSSSSTCFLYGSSGSRYNTASGFLIG